jgi:hypothetical protein
MVRWIWARWMLLGCCFSACAIDSRNVTTDQSLRAGPPANAAGGMEVQPPSVPFGPIPTGFAAPAHLFVQNVGTAPLSAPTVAIGGDGASAFTVTQNDCTAALPVGAHCAIAVAFRPMDLDARAATLSVVSDGASIPIPLFGSGLQPGGLILQPAPGSSALFGDVPIQANGSATLRLSNPTELDSGPLELVSNNEAFSVVPAQPGECASGQTRLASGQTCDLRLSFVPKLRGVIDATITVRSPTAGSIALNVSGNALSPARLLVTPPQLDFGDVVQAAGAQLDLVITNGGDAPLPPITSAVTGMGTNAFRVSANACSAPLAAGASCNLSVSFTPGATGPQSASLELDAGSTGSAEVELQGTGLPAGRLIWTATEGSSNDFGSVVVGTDAEQVFRITNPTEAASGPLSLTVNSADFAVVMPSGSNCVSGVTDLAAGASCDVRVSFTPAQRGQRSATLSVASSVGTTGLNLTGTGLALAALEAQGPVDFGGAPRTSTVTRALNVTNSGDDPLGAVTTSFSGPNAGDFSVQQNACLPGLALGATCSLSLAFTPSASGSRLATLTLTGAPGGTRNIALTGLGLEPGSLVLAPGPGASTNFGGGLVIGSGQSQKQTFVLSNPGQTASGTISIGPLGGGFQSLTPSGGDCISNLTNLQPGSSCTLPVQFTALARGSNTATLTVSSPAAGSTSLVLSGTGLAPALIGAASAQVVFNNPVVVGQTASSALSVRNQGDQATGIVSASVVGFAGDFSVGPGTCTGALAGGASCALDVRFAPSASGIRSSSVRVASTPGGTLDVPVSGTGQLPGALALSAATVTDFGALAVNTSSTLSFTLRNTGELSVGRILGITLGSAFARATPAAGECVPNSTVLDAGASCAFRVLFQPVATGNFSVTMIATSELGGSSSLSISGRAQSPPVLSAVRSLAFVESVFHGNQNSETLHWVISNTGGSTATPLVFSSSNPQEFRSFSFCSDSLDPGSQCEVQFQLAPLVAGPRMATVSMSAGNVSVSATITGTGD